MDDNEIAFRFLDVDGKVIEMASGFNSIKEMSEAIVKSKTFLLESGDSIEFKGSDKEVEDEDFLFPEGTSKEAKRQAGGSMNHQQVEQGKKDCTDGVPHESGHGISYDYGYSEAYAKEQQQ